jgi:hypothetical protein
MIMQRTTLATLDEGLGGGPRHWPGYFTHSLETPGRYALSFGGRRPSNVARFDAGPTDERDESPWFSDYEEAE